ncbi:hypothetical protein BH20CHL6_BH20CHL6_13040 [soil metagenome]
MVPSLFIDPRWTPTIHPVSAVILPISHRHASRIPEPPIADTSLQRITGPVSLPSHARTYTVRSRVVRSIPSESEVSDAEQIKSATESALQQRLIATNEERLAIDSARWWRRREAEQGAPAKGR